MSFDRLQKLIRTRKNPVALTLGVPMEAVPPQLIDSSVDKLGHGTEASADALLRFSTELMDALSSLIPAVILRVPYWAALGWQGLKALDQAAFHARELGLFVIADARRGDANAAAAAYGRTWLGKDGVNADCLTVNAYQGSDAIEPLLELCRTEDKCLLTVARTSNPSAGEIQDLVSGDRVVGQALGDLAGRLGRDDLGEMGYSRIGAMIATPWPSDLRAMRKRLERTFFLLNAGGDGECTLEDAWYAFDKYGRGALVAMDSAPFAWLTSGAADYISPVRSVIEDARDTVKQFITFL